MDPICWCIAYRSCMLQYVIVCYIEVWCYIIIKCNTEQQSLFSDSVRLFYESFFFFSSILVSVCSIYRYIFGLSIWFSLNVSNKRKICSSLILLLFYYVLVVEGFTLNLLEKRMPVLLSYLRLYLFLISCVSAFWYYLFSIQ